MSAVEQFICWLFGLLYLRLAFDLAKLKEGLGYAFVVIMVSGFCFFCGLSGVQTFLRTHMLMTVTDSLKNYGDKIDTYQNSVADMRQDLLKKQATITTNQDVLSQFVTNTITNLTVSFSQSFGTIRMLLDDVKSEQMRLIEQQLDLSNQLVQLSKMTNELGAAQSKIFEQERNLTNIQEQVNAIYDKAQVETISISDTNKAVVLDLPGKKLLVVKLESCPIRYSIQGYMQLPVMPPMTGMQQIPLLPSSYSPVTLPSEYAKNVYSMQMITATPLGGGTVVFSYLKDESKTNLIHSIKKTDDNQVALDNIVVNFK